jgi:haloacetate dehalogenase
MFEAFAVHGVETSRGTIFARVGGHGPVLLLLHGYPQTHLMWHAAAPLLAERLTVVAADLPGYGASFRPAPARSSTSTSAGSGSAPRRTGTRRS